MYGLTFIFAGSWSAGIISLLSCLQYVVFFLFEKKYGHTPKWVGVIFIGLFMTAGALTMEVIYDIIPMLTYSWFTVTLFLNSTKKIRKFTIVPDLSLVLYDIMVKAYANAFQDGIEAVFLICSETAEICKSKFMFMRATLPKKFLCENIGVEFFNLQSVTQENSISEIHNVAEPKEINFLQCPIDRYG